MSYHQKSTCFGCGAQGRGVDYYPLMAGYYHYECWLATGMANIYDALAPRNRGDYDANGATPDPTEQECADWLNQTSLDV